MGELTAGDDCSLPTSLYALVVCLYDCNCMTAIVLQHFGNEQPFLLHAMATCVTRAWPVMQCCGNPRPCIWGCKGDIGKVRTAAVAGVAVLLL